jgi:hypothetical protein
MTDARPDATHPQAVVDRAAAQLMRTTLTRLRRPVPPWVDHLADGFVPPPQPELRAALLQVSDIHEMLARELGVSAQQLHVLLAPAMLRELIGAFQEAEMGQRPDRFDVLIAQAANEVALATQATAVGHIDLTGGRVPEQHESSRHRQ